MNSSRRVTRRDVARLAGVSDAVVTYTLKGTAPVAEATAIRVRAAIAELGYQPNAAAAALRTGTSRTVALLAPVGSVRVFSNPFFTELASAVEDAARARGLDLLVVTAIPDVDALHARLGDLTARQVAGVLLLGGDPVERSSIDAFGVPWLYLNSSDEPGANGVGVDLAAGAATATRHLLETGRRRIAFVGDVERDDRGRFEARRRGWEAACLEAGLEAGPALPADYSREGGWAAGRVLTGLSPRPDAVFAASDLIGIGLLRALRDAELRVPDDIAVASFDGTWEGEYSAPPLTSLRQPLEALAEAALDRLVGGVTGSTLLEGTLVVRASSG
ncbi:LacI family DNA-binding transcriptional regulator [Rathayibacter sp. VKM Ac-2760]|uniref:LacI family DNA-binding transcriptional regulator n=1 Tax=Rathayibacter sp. VKM Ac-2760 TaxID=2609253 RepID=UPI001317ED29|nr:LacI family DNA-binding transcriptional regulator [Rathayibacter sp. VKM Ac-2760]QHC57786.1 substrate-binding domain-containing protein [Rathayibacter sp. VKM Ac-2760]